MTTHEYMVVHQNKFGYVTYCKECGELQLAMGNVLHYLSYKEFSELRGAILKIEEKLLRKETLQDATYTAQLVDERSIVLRSPVDQMYFAFYKDEFEQFSELLNASQVMLQTYDLLNQ